jgi:hypothetical protein
MDRKGWKPFTSKIEPLPMHGSTSPAHSPQGPWQIFYSVQDMYVFRYGTSSPRRGGLVFLCRRCCTVLSARVYPCCYRVKVTLRVQCFQCNLRRKMIAWRSVTACLRSSESFIINYLLCNRVLSQVVANSADSTMLFRRSIHAFWLQKCNKCCM